MNLMLQDKPDDYIQAVKRFGYILAFVFVVLTNLALIKQSVLTPILFLISMYILTGCLWMPLLVHPFYRWFGHYLVKPASVKTEKPSDKFFNKN